MIKTRNLPAFIYLGIILAITGLSHCGQTEASRCRNGSETYVWKANDILPRTLPGANGRFTTCVLLLEQMRQATPPTPTDQVNALAGICNILYDEHIDCGKRSRRWNSARWPLPGDKN